MRAHRLLLASTIFVAVGAPPAIAADLVYNNPAPSYASQSELGETNWTGGYVGAFGGVASGNFEYSASDSTSSEVSGGGALGGLQAGYDFQIGKAVVGGVADIALTNIEADVTIRDRTGSTETSTSASSQVDYLGTVRGRAGYATDRVLAYGHGGLAYGKTEAETSQSQRIGNSTQTSSESRESHTKLGYVVGVGLEYKATETVSLQTEYGYFDLGKDRLLNDQGLRVDEDVDFHAVKGGVNFRF